MRVSKIEFFNIVCPNCGTKITLSADEYKKYIEETRDYCGSEIICMEKFPGEEREVECSRYCMNCPECDHYISLNLSEEDSDTYGFNLPANVSPFYGSYYELSMEDYLNKHFNGETEEENSCGETDDCNSIN